MMIDDYSLQRELDKVKSFLPDLLTTSLNELTSMWPELDQVTDAGFTVKLLR